MQQIKSAIKNVYYLYHLSVSSLLKGVGGERILDFKFKKDILMITAMGFGIWPVFFNIFF